MTTTNTKPSISVIFQQKANTATVRGARGRVGLIIFDDTNKTFTQKTYRSTTDLESDSALYTAENLQFIKDCFMGSPASVTIIRIDKTLGKIADALVIVKGLKLDWVGTASAVITDQDAVSLFINAQEALERQFKAIIFKPTTPSDCKHVVTLANTKVTFTDARGEKNGNEYIPSLLGIFAGLALDKSATYKTLANLKSVIDEADIDTSIQAGKLCLFNDDIDVVKISTAVNSLITLTETNTADMTKIEVVEVMDLMTSDIVSAYKNDFVGEYKNKLDNQIIFISAVNSYFKTLSKSSLLDNLYENKVGINIEEQRQAWVSSGKIEAETWSVEEVMNNSFKNKVFIEADVKVLQSMENLKLTINMQ